MNQIAFLFAAVLQFLVNITYRASFPDETSKAVRITIEIRKTVVLDGILQTGRLVAAYLSEAAMGGPTEFFPLISF